MRIRGWRIDGFGIFHDAVVDDLPPGLTVVAGPNEAGKSTLLAFIRGVLFGFPDGRSRARRHEPVHGGRHGGSISIDADDGTWVVERYADPRALVLRRPDGSLAEDHELTDLLGHADATLFGNVFAFGLSELDGFELLDSDAVRDRVFSAGVVGAGRSAREALATLDARRTALVRPRGRCEVRDLADEARAATRALASARAAAADLARRRDDVERLAAQADDRRTAADACRAEQHRLRALLEVWPTRSRLADVEDELALLQVPEGIDETTEGRFERVCAELAAASVAVDEAELEVASAIERRDAVVVDPALAEVGPAVRALAGDLPTEEARTARLAELDREVVVQRDALEEQLVRLGPDWTRADVAGFDVSIPAADEVRRRGRQIEALEAGLGDLLAERSELESTRDAAVAEIAELEERLGEQDTVAARDAVDRRGRSLRQLRANLVELATESARLDAADRTVAGLRAVMPARSRVAGGAPVGSWLVSVGLVALVLAVAAVVGGARTLGVVLGVGGLAALALGAAVLLTQRSVARPEGSGSLAMEIRDAERVRDTLRSRVEVLRTSVQAAALVLGLPPEPTALDVEECAAAVDADAAVLAEEEAGRRRLDELAGVRERSEERLEQLARELTTLTMTVERERAEWSSWRAERRIPDELGVEAINDLFTAVARARTTLRSLEAVEREWQSLDAASTAFRARAAEVLRRTGVSDDGDDLLVDVRALVERAVADGEARRLSEERAAAVDEAEQRSELVCDRLALARQEHAELLAAAGATDDAGVRQVLGRWRRRRDLVRERDEAIERVHAVVGRGEASEALLAELDRGDPAGWEAALDHAVERLPELEAQHEAAIRTHHDAARALEELSRSGDVADAALRLETVRTRLADAVAEWQVLSAARQLISDTLARYERERQPAVLARAERMFAAVTDGHHRSLSVVDGELSIGDDRGRRLGTDDLSRGTAEQLYLCIRFGLAAEMATHTPLPFVMDDVLVNFDPERTAAMAAVVADLARTHQVLLFTCQPTSVDALLAASPEARVIELPRHGIAER